MEPNSSETLDLRQLLRPVWARKWWILAAVVLTTAITYAYYNGKPKEYQAGTSIFVQQSELEAALFGGSTGFTDDRTIANQASLVRTSAVVRQVARQPAFRGVSPGSLQAQLTVTPRNGQDFIDLSVTDAEPRRAAVLVNAFAQAFIENRSEALRAKVARARQAAERELAAAPATAGTRTSRENLAARVRELGVVESLPSGTAEQLDRATLGVQVAPKPRRNALFAALMSLVLAIGVAFGLNRFDRQLRSLDAVEDAYQLPILGTLPSVGETSPHEDGRPSIAPLFREACRSLRTNVELTSLDRTVKTLVVCSGTAGEGKSTVARSLAMVNAEAGLRVVVVEADVRRPTVSKALDVEISRGLTEVIAGHVSLQEALTEVEYAGGHSAQARVGAETDNFDESGLSGGRLAVLPSGAEPPNPPVILGSDRMLAVLDELAQAYDMVIIDTPPLLVVSDAVPLIAAADATIVVARLDLTVREAARRVSAIISRVPDAYLLGVVANDVTSSDMSGGYRYYSYSAAKPSRFRLRR